MNITHPDNAGRSKFFVIVYRRSEGSRKYLFAVRAFAPELSDVQNTHMAAAAIRADGYGVITGTRHLNAVEVARVEAGESPFLPGEAWL